MGFNIGDKVRVSDDIINADVPVKMKKLAGAIVTISDADEHFEEYNIVEDYEEHYWAARWLTPIKGKVIIISFIAETKEAAMRMAKKKIEEAFNSKDWTDTDISAARDLTASLVSKAVKDGGEVSFKKIGNTISCCLYESSFSFLHETADATPKGRDIPNDWIGKCVSICKVMHEPIPSFILNKNR